MDKESKKTLEEKKRERADLQEMKNEAHLINSKSFHEGSLDGAQWLGH